MLDRSARVAADRANVRSRGGPGAVLQRHAAIPKVGIIMSAAWRAGMLRNARSLARLLTEIDGDLTVVIGMRRDGPYDWPAVEAEAAGNRRIVVRRFQWEAVAAEDAAHIHAIEVPPVPVVMAPRDGGHDFLDCDAWIVFSNSLEGYVVPCRPMAVYCADLIQKYVPEIFGGRLARPMWEKQEETFSSWRASRAVFATTPGTLADVVSYAGVDPERALLVPTLIDPLAADQPARPVEPEPADAPGSAPSHAADAPGSAPLHAADPYILWVTNASPHKNAQGALAALRRYYESGRGSLRVVICGQDTRKLDPRADDRVPQAELFAREPLVLPHLEFAGEVDDRRYLSLLRSAAVVWHNVVIDNGTFVAFDAARAGRLFVSSDYPQMRYLCERYGVDARFHPYDDADAAAGALLAADADFRAGTGPRHRLRGDDPQARRAAYGDILSQLLSQPVGAA